MLCGTILEGLLYALSKKYPEKFNRANSSPKKDGKVKKIDDWLFNDFLNASKDIGLISAEAHNFAKCLQNFRNIIHPREQVKNDYNPKIEVFSECINVLNLLIGDILNNSKRIFENK